MAASPQPTAGNRLAGEASPYLRQHAGNPVHWYPWCDAAFDHARREDKPVFLSVGYSTCHWCHVMAHESFQDAAVAGRLNAHFVCVKVDREEHPAVDDLYMLPTHLLTGRGGWPNSVWLTADRRPWFAGTYYPRAAFLDLLDRLADLWARRRPEVEQQAEQLTAAVRQAATAPLRLAPADLGPERLDEGLRELRSRFDPRHGGFGAAPKFPPHTALRLLLDTHEHRPDPALLAMVTTTLDAMADGGLHDHLAGGFHRYSTDDRWFLPHFEKMLYDNAQMARVYAEAARLTGHRRYADVARSTCDWVLRDLALPEGGFHAALDADSEGEEGRFYLWTWSDLQDRLGPADAPLFARVFGATAAGNCRAEADGRHTGANLLHRPLDMDTAARREGLTPEALATRLEPCRQRLLEHRRTRPWPHLDDHVLTGWNGLMIGALAVAGRNLGEPRYLEAATRAAQFVWTGLRTADGHLLRTWHQGRPRLDAGLDDYAFLAEGFLDLAAAGGDPLWQGAARDLLRQLAERFLDPVDGGFHQAPADPDRLLLRVKTPYDNATPNGNGVAAQALLRLAVQAADPAPAALAEAVLRAFSGAMAAAPSACASLLLADAHRRRLPPGLRPADPATPPAAETPAARVRHAPLEAALFLARPVVGAGHRLSVALRVHTDAGWHVAAHEPGWDDAVPAGLTLAGPAWLALRDVRYPAATPRPAGQDQPALGVYAGQWWVRADLEVAPDAPPGEVPVVFTVTAQPCDDRRCLPPVRLDLPLRLTVLSSACR